MRTAEEEALRQYEQEQSIEQAEIHAAAQCFDAQSAEGATRYSMCASAAFF
jgi:hypothetical protein